MESMIFRQESVGTGAVPVSRFDKVTNVRLVAGKAVCKLQTAFQSQGSGSLYHVWDKSGRKRYLIMTCHHVLPTNSIIEIIQTHFLFEDIPQMADITLAKEHVDYVWASKSLDATVIEISPELAARFASYGAQFLEVAAATPNIDVVILQYPNGRFSIADGDIDKVNGNKVFYRIGTAPGSSGSPLINMDCMALAMHNAGTEGFSSHQAAATRMATDLQAVIEAYLEERSHVESKFLSDYASPNKLATFSNDFPKAGIFSFLFSII